MEVVDLQRVKYEESGEVEALPSAIVITVKDIASKFTCRRLSPREVILRFIISGNGSTDGRQEFLEHEFPEARVNKNRGNIWFAAANNRAAEIGDKEILVFINPDTSVHEDWLYHLLMPFKYPCVRPDHIKNIADERSRKDKCVRSSTRPTIAV